MIWDSMAERGIRQDEPGTWPPLAEPGGLEGESFTAAGSCLALSGACDELIGPGRWISPVDCGGAVVVRFPSENRANAGYHIEGSYDGPGGYWINICSRARGLLALFLFSDIGPQDAPTRLCVARTWQSRSSWRLTGRLALWPMPSSGARQRCAGRSPMPPAGPGTSTCAIRSSCTPPPGHTGAPCRASSPSPPFRSATGSRSTDLTPRQLPGRSSRAWRWPIDAARHRCEMITRTTRRADAIWAGHSRCMSKTRDELQNHRLLRAANSSQGPGCPPDLDRPPRLSG
jgi:hypothetical protein